MFFSHGEMLIRLILAAVVGGVIGYEREIRGRDAGIRTHALVSLGAAIITLAQLKASEWVINFVVENPEFLNILTSDITRMTAQIVSGIGFLGAGTIIVSRRSITGLTTAASIWAVAGLGISIGMGHYLLGVSGSIIILIVLIIVKSLFKMDQDKNMEIQYLEGDETIKLIEQIFSETNVKVLSEDYSSSYADDEEPLYKVVYELHIPTDIKLKNLMDIIGQNENVQKISTIKWI